MLLCAFGVGCGAGFGRPMWMNMVVSQACVFLPREGDSSTCHENTESLWPGEKACGTGPSPQLGAEVLAEPRVHRLNCSSPAGSRARISVPFSTERLVVYHVAFVWKQNL